MSTMEVKFGDECFGAIYKKLKQNLFANNGNKYDEADLAKRQALWCTRQKVQHLTGYQVESIDLHDENLPLQQVFQKKK